MDDGLIRVATPEEIPQEHRGTPIGDLLEYHNLGRPLDDIIYDRAKLLVGMCMDHRKHLRIPENFSYIIRAGGGNMRYSEFKVSYAVAVGGVRAIALMGHTGCGMSNLMGRRDLFIEGLVDVGWDRTRAENHFNQFAPMFEIGDAQEFITSEAVRLNSRYPKVTVVPMMYKVEDNRIYIVRQ